MKQHDIFISKYKELESLLTKPVREYEESLSDNDAQKMRICRMVRNYIQHNDDYEKFIAIAPGMQAYIDNVVDEIHKQNGLLKDQMVSIAKYGVLTEGDTILNAATLMSKKKRNSNIVLDKNGEILGMITKEIISDIFASGNLTKTTKISKITDSLIPITFMLFNQTSAMDIVNMKIENNNYLIVATNNSQKIVGFLNII